MPLAPVLLQVVLLGNVLLGGEGEGGQDDNQMSVSPSPLFLMLWADGPDPRMGWAEARGSPPPGPTGMCLSSRGSGRIREGRVQWLQLDREQVPSARSCRGGRDFLLEAAWTTGHGGSSQVWVPMLHSSQKPCLDPHSLTGSPNLAKTQQASWKKDGKLVQTDVCKVSVDFPGISRC